MNTLVIKDIDFLLCILKKNYNSNHFLTLTLFKWKTHFPLVVDNFGRKRQGPFNWVGNIKSGSRSLPLQFKIGFFTDRSSMSFELICHRGHIERNKSVINLSKKMFLCEQYCLIHQSSYNFVLRFSRFLQVSSNCDVI